MKNKINEKDDSQRYLAARQEQERLAQQEATEQESNTKVFDDLVAKNNKDKEDTNSNDYKYNSSLSQLKKDFNNTNNTKTKANIFNNILNELVKNEDNRGALNALFNTYGTEYVSKLGSSLGTNEMYNGNQFIQFLNNSNFKDFCFNIKPDSNTFSKAYNLYASGDLLTNDYINNENALIYKKSLYDKSMSDIMDIVKLDKKLLRNDINPKTLRTKVSESLLNEDVAVRDAVLLDSSKGVLDLPVIKKRIEDNNLDLDIDSDKEGKLKKEVNQVLKKGSDDDVTNIVKLIWNNDRGRRAIETVKNNANNDN